MVVTDGNRDYISMFNYTNNADMIGSKVAGTVVLVCQTNSHPFQDRTLLLDQPVKIGRSVARARPSHTNGIFDCKVLSRNHALFWYTNGKFFLQDTKSSNGTFVNNQRLSLSGEESAAREVYFGDMVQFGVDVLENSRKVTHGCIVANLELYHPDGKEAKPNPANLAISSMGSVPIEDLYQLNQNIQEALQREQLLQLKIASLQKMLAALRQAADLGWKALINEDRLLSRVEILENQLQLYTKNHTDDKLREELNKLQEDKITYQGSAKEVLRKIVEEKTEAVGRIQLLEMALQSTEIECQNLKEVINKSKGEFKELAQKHSQRITKTEELQMKLNQFGVLKEYLSRLENEKEELTVKLEKAHARETELKCVIDDLKTNIYEPTQLVKSQQLRENNSINASLHSGNHISDLYGAMIVGYAEKSENVSEVHEMLDQVLERSTTVIEEIKESQDVVDLLSAQTELIQKQKMCQLQDINKIELTMESQENIVHNNRKDIEILEEFIESQPSSMRRLEDLPEAFRNRLHNVLNGSEVAQKESLLELLAESRENTKEAEYKLSLSQKELENAKNSLEQLTETFLKQDEKLKEAKKLKEDQETTLHILKEQIGSLQAKEIELQNRHSEKLDIAEEKSKKTLEELESLKSQLQNAQQSEKQTRWELDFVKDKLIELQRLQNEREEGVDEVSLQLHATQKELDNKKQEELVFLKRINLLETQISSFNKEVESVKLDLNEALKEKNKVEEKLVVLSDAAKTACQDHTDSSVVTSLEDKISELSEQIVQQKDQYMTLLEEKTTIADELSKLQVEYNSLTHHPYFHSLFAIPLLILIVCTVIQFYPLLSMIMGTAEPNVVFSSSNSLQDSQLPTDKQPDISETLI